MVVLAITFALVRTRGRGDATLLEPPPATPVARATPTETTPTEVDEELAAAVDEALAPAVEAPEVDAAPEAPTRPRFRDRLGKARGQLAGYVGSVLSRGKIDEETWDELEEALIRADVGRRAHHRAARRAAGARRRPTASPRASSCSTRSRTS